MVYRPTGKNCFGSTVGSIYHWKYCSIAEPPHQKSFWIHPWMINIIWKSEIWKYFIYFFAMHAVFSVEYICFSSSFFLPITLIFQKYSNFSVCLKGFIVPCVEDWLEMMEKIRRNWVISLICIFLGKILIADFTEQWYFYWYSWCRADTCSIPTRLGCSHGNVSIHSTWNGHWN